MSENRGLNFAHAALEAARTAARGSTKPGRPVSKRRRDRGASEPLRLGDSISGLVSERGWEMDLAVSGVVARWAQIVGSEVAEHVRPDRFDRGTLYLAADSTAWATQVRLLTPDFLRRLSAEIGPGVIEKLEVGGPAAPSWRKGPRSVPGRGPRDTYG